MVHSHTSGTLKQSNKKHKSGGINSNRAIKRNFGAGKVNIPTNAIKKKATDNLAR